MQYCTVAQLKARVKTDLDDGALADIIAEQSALITLVLAKEPGSPMVEEFSRPGRGLWLAYAPSGATLVVEDLEAGREIDPDTYLVSGRMLLRRSALDWPVRTRVTYAMADSPGVLAVARGVCIDLCRLAINDPGVDHSESLGDYSHATKDVQAERRKVLARLAKITGIRPAIG